MSRSSLSVNVFGASAKPMFVYESLARRRSRPASVISRWSNASFGSRSTECQFVSSGRAGIDTERDDAEVRRRELPLPRVPPGLAERLELLEVRELADVDLGREVPADRLLERLVRVEIAAREGPGAGIRILRTLPEQHLQLSRAHLETRPPA